MTDSHEDPRHNAHHEIANGGIGRVPMISSDDTLSDVAHINFGAVDIGVLRHVKNKRKIPAFKTSAGELALAMGLIRENVTAYELTDMGQRILDRWDAAFETKVLLQDLPAKEWAVLADTTSLNSETVETPNWVKIGALAGIANAMIAAGIWAYQWWVGG